MELKINPLFTFVKKYKLFFIIFGLLALSRLMFFICYVSYARINNLTINFFNFITETNVCGNDTGWYNDIINNGYRITEWKNKYNWNFFPFFPLLLKGIKTVLHVNNNYYLAFFVNSILTGFTCYFVYKYLEKTRGNSNVGYIAIFLILFGPWSFYTIQLMSEALYMFLLILCFYFLIKEKYILMGIMGALLTGTRSTGVFFILVALIYYMYNLKIKNNYNIKETVLFTLKDSKFLLGLCLIPIGLVSFMLYLQLKIGDGFGFIHSQKYGWGHSIEYNIFYLIAKDFGNGRVFLVLIVLAIISICIYMAINNRFYETIMPLLIIVFAHNVSLNGIQRYAFSALTVLFGFIDILMKFKISKNIKFKIPVAIILVGFNYSLYYFVMKNIFGYLYI